MSTLHWNTAALLATLLATAPLTPARAGPWRLPCFKEAESPLTRAPSTEAHGLPPEPQGDTPEMRLARAELRLEQARAQEFSPAAQLALLLLDKGMPQHFPLLEGRLRTETPEWLADIGMYEAAGHLIILLEVTNRRPSQPWTLERVEFFAQDTGVDRPHVVRARPASIPPGATGYIAIATPRLPKGHRQHFKLLVYTLQEHHPLFALMNIRY